MHMHTLQTIIAAAFLLAGSVSAPTPAGRSAAQLKTQISAATIGRRAWWAVAVLIVAPAYTALVAARTTLWLAVAAAAYTLCVLASVLAMDGRALRVARQAGGRA